MDFDQFFSELLFMTQEGNDYILLAIWILFWILDHPGFFTIRRYGVN